MNYIILSIAAFLAGISGSLGLGGGSVMLLYLTLFANTEQVKAQGINLIFFIPCAVLAVILHSKGKLIVWKKVIIYAVIGSIGVIIGTFLVGIIGEEILRKIFAGLLLIIGLRELFSKKEENNKN